jgi:hypothetical protein
MGFTIIAAILIAFGLAPDQVFAQSAVQTSPSAGDTSVAANGSTSAMPDEMDILAVPAQELRDKPVFDTRHERIATLKEVTGTPGSARQAILQTGGVLGVGGNEVKLPLDKLEMGPGGELVLTMTESELRLLPRAD